MSSSFFLLEENFDLEENLDEDDDDILRERFESIEKAAPPKMMVVLVNCFDSNAHVLLWFVVCGCDRPSFLGNTKTAFLFG